MVPREIEREVPLLWCTSIHQWVGIPRPTKINAAFQWLSHSGRSVPAPLHSLHFRVMSVWSRMEYSQWVSLHVSLFVVVFVKAKSLLESPPALLAMVVRDDEHGRPHGSY